MEDIKDSSLAKKNSAVRIDITIAKKAVPVPAQANFIWFKVIGSNPVAWNFNDDSDSDFVKFDPGFLLPFPIGVNSKTVINFKGIGGDSEVEGFFW